MLGLGSYTFRWSIGHKGLVPEKPMTAFDVLAVAKEHKLSVVQYADNLPLDTLSNNELNTLYKQAAIDGIALELGTQSFNAKQVAQYLEIGKRIHAKILRVALDGPDAKKSVVELAQEFKELTPIARAAGIKIAIENHFNYPSRQMVELLKEIDDDQVGVCLDVANSICAGEWPMETVGILASSTINLHLKDYVIAPDAYGVGFTIHGTPLGTGKTDCQAVLDAIPNVKDMSVIMEHWLPQKTNMDLARKEEHIWLEKSVDYARNNLGLN